MHHSLWMPSKIVEVTQPWQLLLLGIDHVLIVGARVGTRVGERVGAVGAFVGATDGRALGALLGTRVGAAVMAVGSLSRTRRTALLPMSAMYRYFHVRRDHVVGHIHHGHARGLPERRPRRRSVVARVAALAAAHHG